jgi:hypothetical protein
MYLQQHHQQEEPATQQQGNWLADVADAGTSTAASTGSSRQLLASNSASGQRTPVSLRAAQHA